MNFFKLKKELRIDRILNRDQSALIEIYQRIQRDIQHFIIDFGGSVSDVDEAIQKALVRLWENVHQKKIVMESETIFFVREASKYFWSLSCNNTACLNDINSDIIASIESSEKELSSCYYNDQFKPVSDAFHNLSKISQKILNHVYWEKMNYSKLSTILKLRSESFAKEKKESSLQALLEKIG